MPTYRVVLMKRESWLIDAQSEDEASDIARCGDDTDKGVRVITTAPSEFLSVWEVSDPVGESHSMVRLDSIERL